MNLYFRQLFVYFEQVIHPAGGNATAPDKRKRKSSRSGEALQPSPECYNIRGGIAKKQEKLRRNPAP
jgi:hypothetical protein